MSILKTVILALVVSATSSGNAIAQTLAPLVTRTDEAVFAELGEKLQISRLMEQLRQEGLNGAVKLAAQFDIDGTGGFQVQMNELFDVAAMEAMFLAQLQQALQHDPETLQAVLTFFASPLGQKAVLAEIAARQEVTGDTGKAAAKALYEAISTKDPQRRDLLDGMITAGDLVEFNVMGGLNANLAFLKGMAATGALGELPESEMVAQVWRDEEALRKDSAEWLTGYVAVAYRDLTLAELQEYSDFLASRTGKKLNAALFAGFDTLFLGLSGQQGRITGQLMQGDEI